MAYEVINVEEKIEYKFKTYPIGYVISDNFFILVLVLLRERAENLVKKTVINSKAKI